MKTHVVKTFEYIGKFSDICLFLDYSLNAMVYPDVKKGALQKWMNGIPSLVRDERFINKALPKEQLEKFALKFEEQIKESYLKKFNDCNKIILNMSLVMICTAMEMFLEHIFLTIMNANPQTLLTLSKDRNITLEQLLKFNDYDKVLDHFKEKYIEHITRQGTKEILNAFDSVGIKTNSLFSWSDFTDEVQKQFASWNDKTLIDIFNERHSIVHDNLYPINDIQEFVLRKDFFTKIILNLSVETWHKFYKYGVILDSHELIRNAVKAEGGDPNSYPPPPRIGEGVL